MKIPRAALRSRLALLRSGACCPFTSGALGHVPTPEVVAHRVIWAVPVALGWLLYLGRTADLRLAIRTPRMLGMAVVTAALISLNWGAYVWLIQSGQAMEAALGYYINPIFSVFLGSIFLGERLSARQWGAVALAFAAVVVLTVEAGSLPLGALVLVFSWGGYAFFKRALPIGPNQGFALEALILLPVALAFMGWQAAQGNLFAAQASGVDWLYCWAAGLLPRCRSSFMPMVPKDFGYRPSRFRAMRFRR